MSNYITVNQLSFSYQKENILENIHFEIQEGDFIAITGANGSGKSTLMRLLIGDLAPTEGSISFFGKSYRSQKSISGLSYVAQKGSQNNFSFPVTAYEYVRSGLYEETGLFHFYHQRHQKKVTEALQMVNMLAHKNQLLSTLSGGQVQRVLLAKALISAPKILLLDEPMTGIDQETTRSIFEILKRLNIEKKTTIVVITHDLDFTKSYVNRIMYIKEKGAYLHEYSGI
ncbi:MAG: metal ABC transporter ATP-binding protein [Vallitaleaceae bacterium]|nr:metal ABC transporter ATP-binding protein [Vallitaleaceae bacterium]